MTTPTTLRDESTLAASQGGGGGLHLLVMGPKQFATFALPPRGEIVVGRGDRAGVDVKLDDAKASRRHLRLQVGDAGELTIEDLGSANGTRVGGRKLTPQTRAPVLPGEAISVGALVLMVQPDRPAAAHGRGQPISHAEFEGRVEWECTRAEATGGTFSVARLAIPPGAAPEASSLRPVDVIGLYGPRECELLLPGLGGDIARPLVAAFAQRLGSGGSVGIASYPLDGRHVAALLARAGAHARGPASDAGFGEEVFYRGYLQRSLRNRFRPMPSIGGAALLFAVRHYAQLLLAWPHIAWASATIWVVATFVVGLALGWLYEKSASLWPSIGCHYLFNLLA